MPQRSNQAFESTLEFVHTRRQLVHQLFGSFQSVVIHAGLLATGATTVASSSPTAFARTCEVLRIGRLPDPWTLDPWTLDRALWHDRNGNGVSERGEVRPVAAWGIAALSTSWRFDAMHPHEIPWSRAGVRFTDGTVRPTWDVVLERM